MKRILLALLISLLSCGLAVADVDTIDGQAVASGEGVSCTDTTKEDFSHSAGNYERCWYGDNEDPIAGKWTATASYNICKLTVSLRAYGSPVINVWFEVWEDTTEDGYPDTQIGGDSDTQVWGILRRVIMLI
jgi:hypothetical protein